MTKHPTSIRDVLAAKKLSPEFGGEFDGVDKKPNKDGVRNFKFGDNQFEFSDELVQQHANNYLASLPSTTSYSLTTRQNLWSSQTFTMLNILASTENKEHAQIQKDQSALRNYLRINLNADGLKMVADAAQKHGMQELAYFIQQHAQTGQLNFPQHQKNLVLDQLGFKYDSADGIEIKYNDQQVSVSYQENGKDRALEFDQQSYTRLVDAQVMNMHQATLKEASDQALKQLSQLELSKRDIREEAPSPRQMQYVSLKPETIYDKSLPTVQYDALPSVEQSNEAIEAQKNANKKGEAFIRGLMSTSHDQQRAILVSQKPMDLIKIRHSGIANLRRQNIAQDSSGHNRIKDIRLHRALNWLDAKADAAQMVQSAMQKSMVPKIQLPHQVMSHHVDKRILKQDFEKLNTQQKGQFVRALLDTRGQRSGSVALYQQSNESLRELSSFAAKCYAQMQGDQGNQASMQTEYLRLAEITAYIRQEKVEALKGFGIDSKVAYGQDGNQQTFIEQMATLVKHNRGDLIAHMLSEQTPDAINRLSYDVSALRAAAETAQDESSYYKHSFVEQWIEYYQQQLDQILKVDHGIQPEAPRTDASFSQQ